MNLYDLNDIELAKVFAVEVAGWKLHDHPDCMAKKENWFMPEKWCLDPNSELQFNHDMEKYAKIEHILPFLEKEILERNSDGVVEISEVFNEHDCHHYYTVIGISQGVLSFPRAASIALIDKHLKQKAKLSQK